MIRIKLTISYSGDCYCGWQVQKDKPTVQSAMQDALSRIYGMRPNVIGCSRTDSGVHANNYVCCFDIPTELDSVPIDKIPSALASVLPYDISCKSAERVTEDFHPRYSCLGKEYRYLILNSEIPNPFLHNRVWQCKKALDIDAMKKAAVHIMGKHDFASFMASGSKITDSVREVMTLDITKENELVTVSISADGFLYNMVRIIAGTLVEVGKGSIEPSQLASIIESKDRKNAGVTAPACGLYLNRIFYRKEDIL